MGQMGSPTALSGSMSSAPVAMPGHLPVAPAAFLHDPMACVERVRGGGSSAEEGRGGKGRFWLLVVAGSRRQSVAQMGLKLGTDALQSSMAAYLPGAVYVWHLLRRYFAVDRQYVVAKLAILAFPWRHGDWARKFEEEFVQDSPQSAPRRVVRYNLPTADVNAPDLYIPLMGFVTYVLLVGLAKGTEMQFTPEVLGQVTSTGIVTLLLEVAVMYGALRAFAGGESVALLDLTAFAAYKYVGLVAASVGWLLAGSVAYYALLLYSGVAMARFLVSALQNDLPVPEIAGRQAQNVVTLAIAGAQILLMLWLGAF
jgi:hypothetical protein